MRNIYLVGFMGTGKTVVGKDLAKRLNKEFVEMDTVIAETEGREIVDIFDRKGEAYFRKLEKELLKELCLKTDLVISCGGGLICDEENLKQLKKTGIVFALTASPLTIYQRTKEQAHRPILNVDDPQAKIRELLDERDPYYKQAHHLIDTENILPGEITGKIITILNNG